MAQHKAPTQVTLAPIGERSALAAFFERYWKGLAIGFAVLSAAILFRVSQTARTHAVEDEGWNELRRAVQVTNSQFGMPSASFAMAPGELAQRATDRDESQAAPWMLAMAAVAHAERREYAEAARLANELRTRYPKHPLSSWPLLDAASGEGAATGDAGGASGVAPAAALAESSAAMAAWVEANPQWFNNPPLPEGAPRVRLETTAGPIELGLYVGRAPRHVENFLKLVDEGYYAGTKFHRVVPSFMIQGGDPNSREPDPSTWGQGGPDYKLDPEFSDLRHVRGALAAAKMGGDIQSSGSQFYITTAPAHHLDNQHTVFGTVLSGWAAIEAIEQGPRVENTDRPRDPVVIERAARL